MRHSLHFPSPMAVRTFLLAVLLLPGASFSPTISCRWTFDSCVPGTSPCLALHRKMDDDGQICAPGKRQFPLPAQSSLCSSKCTIQASWCPWGPWTNPMARCGSDGSRQSRVRRRCCHPGSGKTDPRVLCDKQRSRELRHRQWAPCVQDEPGRPDYSHQYLWNVFTAGVTAVLMIIVIAFLCYRRCPRSPLLTSQDIRDTRPPPPYQKSWRQSRETPPPKYEVALQYAL